MWLQAMVVSWAMLGGGRAGEAGKPGGGGVGGVARLPAFSRNNPARKAPSGTHFSASISYPAVPFRLIALWICRGNGGQARRFVID